MRVALIGGTGFVGSYLTDALIAAGHEPSLLVRDGSEHKVQHADRCRIVLGGLSSKEAIDSVLHAADAVIYSVGILREQPSNGVTFEAMQYQGVVDVAKAAVAHRISRFLLISANGVKFPGTAYQETKFRAEAYLRETGLAATVFRPSVIFGNPRGRMEFATQLNRDMVQPPLPAVSFFTGLSPRQGVVRMSPAFVRDVADAVIAALEDQQSIGQTYELGGPEILGWDEIVRRIARVSNKRKWIVPVPVSLMKIPARLMSWLPAFPVTVDQLTMLAEGNTAPPDTLAALIKREPTRFDDRSLDYLAA